MTGHRLLRGGIFPGGAHLHRLPRPGDLEEIGDAFHAMVDLACSNSIVMDRFTGTAVLRADQAAEIGVLGVVARASGLNLDVRLSHPTLYSPTGFTQAYRDTGDVLARFLVRCDEVDISLALLSDYIGGEGSLAVSVSDHTDNGGRAASGGRRMAGHHRP